MNAMGFSEKEIMHKEWLEAIDEATDKGSYDSPNDVLPDACERCGGTLEIPSEISSGEDEYTLTGASKVDGVWVCNGCYDDAMTEHNLALNAEDMWASREEERATEERHDDF